MTILKLLNVFEISLLLLIAYVIKHHYDPFVNNSFFYYNSFFRILSDVILVCAILIRLKDLSLNFNQSPHSYKKYYLPLVIYTIAILPDLYFYTTWLFFAKHLFPAIFIVTLPILILIGRIIFTKKYLKTKKYSEDILDAN